MGASKRSRVRDISGAYADLYLFSIDRNYDEFGQQDGHAIVFYLAGDQGYAPASENYEATIKRTMRIKLVAESGRPPSKPYQETVEEILRDAIQQTAE
ncbi:MAG: hypothetical protein FJ358_01820 [Thaumarchaeota archaeon]|nr:hypothetical protein [Nitrososphaerota archaeon]